tara:strand:- start:158 stop:352 length:195 start_codon:yes stop_codon:yes gene_type:complete
MKIYIPHPFKEHDNFFHLNIGSICMFVPWKRKHLDADIKILYDDEVYDNYAGWLWFTVNWYSTK